ncbi:hypothetical protein NPIL_384921 [Nephila pilipes]|uniref:Uncharacterized protein n=1 Tax=Nephila pilipes TaxID=299642 RepID=A0A8X6UCU0_NEPPI|nr:hypothetical protein NPIL_384921 [Nephila pilipes]
MDFLEEINVVRLAKVKIDNGIFLRLMHRLFPLKISQSEDDPLPGGDLLYKQAFQRQSAFLAAGPEQPTQDVASASSVVTRTGRVIMPSQRLDLSLSSSEFPTLMMGECSILLQATPPS